MPLIRDVIAKVKADRGTPWEPGKDRNAGVVVSVLRLPPEDPYGFAEVRVDTGYEEDAFDVGLDENQIDELIRALRRAKAVVKEHYKLRNAAILQEQ